MLAVYGAKQDKNEKNAVLASVDVVVVTVCMFSLKAKHIHRSMDAFVGPDAMPKNYIVESVLNVQHTTTCAINTNAISLCRDLKTNKRRHN